ncbi:hypothetical protein F4782DRAFT_547258 [Xylaria castorea]|nr:hypothetical protein F4782DRAFT_547258 [Xylaria castorea]
MSQQSLAYRVFNIAYKDRWEDLKPVIVKLYLGDYGQEGKATKLSQVVDFMRLTIPSMRRKLSSEYRSHFRTWNISKRVVNNIKDDPGTSTSHVIVLARYLKEQRRPRLIEAITPELLSSWSLPYEAFIASLNKEVNKPSPLGLQGTTPDHVDIKSPVLVRAAPSPNMQLVYQKAREDRAMLFLQERTEELVVTVCREDRKLLVDHFHDFYIHGFTMAREWGKQLVGSHNSPVVSTVVGSSSRIQVSIPPTRLCNWSIHVPPPHVHPPIASFADELRQSIAYGGFNNTPVEDLPIAQDNIVRGIETDPKALEIDAWKLAIMAGNCELIYQLYGENGRKAPDGLDEIHPFHLAASFLDGGHTCCKVFDALIQCLRPPYAFHHNVDNLGHTILDAFTVSILGSHTAICPDSVNYVFRSPNRFPGEEIDICGRWTADTPRLRELFRQGFCQIPTTWKHPFCHTAVQAICHSIIAVYGVACAPSVNTMSGLFIRRCTECGLELKPGPLHSLVVTTFYLANLGMTGETFLGADASLTVNISVDEILRTSDAGDCSHTHLSSLELMKKVPENIIDDWSSDCKVAERQRESRPNFASNSDAIDQSGKVSDYNSELESDGSLNEILCELVGEDGDSYHLWTKFKCSDGEIGLLWATIQTEFLTYRRKFSMKSLEDWLLGYSATFQTPLVTEHLMRRHSRCGWFLDGDFAIVHPAAQEVSASYFMNMDIYERTAYIHKNDVQEIWTEYVE